MTFSQFAALVAVPVLLSGAFAYGIVVGMWVSGEDVRILRGKK